MTVSFDFSNRHVFVAGGTSGINLGIALAFAERGARVSVLSRSIDKIDQAVAALTARGAAATGYAADVRQYDAVAAALAAAVAGQGPLDVLISGAAGNFPAAILGMSANAFRSVVDIDLIGTFNVMRAGFEHLKRPGASVINISAPQALHAMALQAHVCAAKAGVDMITRTLALEWGPMGIRVNSIIPGPIDGTEGMKRLAGSEQAMVTRTVPLRRMGTPDDVAQVALFLASDAAAYVSGAVIPADGGWSVSGAGAAMATLAQAAGNPA